MRTKLLSIGAAFLVSLSGISAVQAPTASAQISTQDSGRWCPSGYFGWSDFGGFRGWLDQRYGRQGRIWSVPNDGVVWDIWCRVTNSKATLQQRSGQNAVVSPSTVFLNDGTRLDFRTSSRSGGYTIDINTTTHTKNFKVHVR